MFLFVYATSPPLSLSLSPFWFLFSGFSINEERGTVERFRGLSFPFVFVFSVCTVACFVECLTSFFCLFFY